MANPLFSTYSQGENRITATIIAVFERLSFGLVERILQAMCQEPESSLLTFGNQPLGQTSTPDGLIRASFAYWIETKRVPHAVNASQVHAHLKALEADTKVERQRLLVLSPDSQRPADLDRLADSRVAWASFEDLLTAIRDVIEPGDEWLVSDKPTPSEQERGLLRELIQFLRSEKLIGGGANRVVVVAARTALQEYLNHSVYMCQPHRAFQPFSRLAFYADGKISRWVPSVLGTVESAVLTEHTARSQQGLEEPDRNLLLVLVGDLQRAGSPRLGTEAKIVFLSGPDSSQTRKLSRDIVNDLLSNSGRPVAFTQGQRYVKLSSLEKEPRTTSQLLAIEGTSDA